MAKIIISYKLKSGVTREQFETWVKTTDQPTMRGLSRVASFDTHRAEKLLLGEGAPSADYIEIFDVPDLDGFLAEDMGGAVVQSIMGQFMGLVEAPEFVIATTL